MLHHPTKSMWKLTQEINLSRMTAHRAMTKELQFYPYKYIKTDLVKVLGAGNRKLRAEMNGGDS